MCTWEYLVGCSSPGLRNKLYRSANTTSASDYISTINPIHIVCTVQSFFHTRHAVHAQCKLPTAEQLLCLNHHRRSPFSPDPRAKKMDCHYGTMHKGMDAHFSFKKAGSFFFHSSAHFQLEHINGGFPQDLYGLQCKTITQTSLQI